MTNAPSPKKLKDMTPQERDAAVRRACAQLQEEFNRPDVQEKLSAVLRGGRVDN